MTGAILAAALIVSLFVYEIILGAPGVVALSRRRKDMGGASWGAAFIAHVKDNGALFRRGDADREHAVSSESDTPTRDDTRETIPA